MMKTIMIRPDGTASVKKLSDFKALNVHFNGLVERVTSPRLPQPFCMGVDEEGKCKGLPRNDFGSWLYGVDKHGEIIVGDVFLLKTEKDSEGYYLAGLTDQDIHHLAGRFQLELVPAAADA
ncbi:MAG: DUF3846 domain-containing protein [Firmicutes bacterium]|nr:DUF3846 domain-containing protein [Bacillota bacterium]